MTVSIEIAQEVRRLDDAGLTGRQIAREVAISRGTVAAIINGTWRPPKSHDPNDPDSTSHDPTAGPRRRCPECGRLMYIHPSEPVCLECKRTRQKREALGHEQ